MVTSLNKDDPILEEAETVPARLSLKRVRPTSVELSKRRNMTKSSKSPNRISSGGYSQTRFAVQPITQKIPEGQKSGNIFFQEMNVKGGEPVWLKNNVDHLYSSASDDVINSQVESGNQMMVDEVMGFKSPTHKLRDTTPSAYERGGNEIGAGGHLREPRLLTADNQGRKICMSSSAAFTNYGRFQQNADQLDSQQQ